MIDLIKADATARSAAEAGRWQECATRVNAIAPPVRKPESEARKTWVGLQSLFGLTRAALWKANILEAIQDAEGDGDVMTIATLSLMDQSLGGVGYDFGDPQVQEQLEMLEAMGILTEADVQDLQSVGVSRVMVTAEQVEQEWQAYTQSLIESQVATVLNEIVNPAIATGDLQTISSALRQAADMLEGA